MQYEELDLGSSPLQKEKEDSFIMALWDVLMGYSMDDGWVQVAPIAMYHGTHGTAHFSLFTQVSMEKI